MTGEPIRLEAAKKQFEKFYTENMKGVFPSKKFLSHYMVLIWEQHWHVNFWIIFFRNFARKIKKEYISIRMYLLILLSSGFLIAHAIRQPVVTTGWTIFMWLGLPGNMISSVLGEKAIDQNSPLPDVVNSALHLIAAHERRPWRGLYLLGEAAKIKNTEKNCFPVVVKILVAA